MRTSVRRLAVWALISAGLAGCSSGQAGPRVYRYVCDYQIYDALAKFQSKMRVQAIHTRDLPGGGMRWSEPSICFGTTLNGDYTPPIPQSYMEGFGYPASEVKNMLTPEFFKGFPVSPLGMLMKNAVIDVHTFDCLLTDLDRLRPNEPCAFSGENQEMSLFGKEGTQTLRKLDLTWIGTSRRNGKVCKVIRYRAEIAPLSLTVPGAEVSGCTLFWGEMWVPLGDHAVEQATLSEHTLIMPPDPEAKIRSLQNICRTLTLQRTGE